MKSCDHSHHAAAHVPHFPLLRHYINSEQEVSCSYSMHYEQILQQVVKFLLSVCPIANCIRKDHLANPSLAAMMLFGQWSVEDV